LYNVSKTHFKSEKVILDILIRESAQVRNLEYNLGKKGEKYGSYE